MLTLCKELLQSDDTSVTMASQVMSCLCTVIKEDRKRMQEVAEIISEIQMPSVIEQEVVAPDEMHQLKGKVNIPRPCE